MATYKYNHAVKVNGEIYSPNTDIEVPDRNAAESPKPEKAAKSQKSEKKAASKKATKADDKKAAVK